MNPFTERSRITNPLKFTGRWRELSMVFERIERRRPVMIAGVSGIGKSSLLTHIAQSAAAVLELPDLASFYLDLTVLPDARTCLGLIVRELERRGDTVADLEAGLVDFERTVLICLDGAESAIAAGWGENLIEQLARTARKSVPVYPGGPATPGMGAFDMLLVVAANGQPPALSEPFATVVLGAIAPTEVRLLTEAYLDETAVSFSPAELRELTRLSIGHPAYLQRAAFHLFASRGRPDYDWRTAFLDEARDMPIPGAPLPDSVFSAEGALALGESGYGEVESGEPLREISEWKLEGATDLIVAILPLLAALLAYLLIQLWWAALIVLILGYLIVVIVRRRG